MILILKYIILQKYSQTLNNSEHSDYYSIDKYNENYVTNVNDLNIIHCNIRSLYAHHDEFLSLLSVLRVKFDILCFPESWLTDH